MELFVQTTVFNPSLIGKAVRIKGFDRDGEKWDRVFLVKKTDGENITLTDYTGQNYTFHLENFSFEDNDLLKMTVLEAI